MLNMETFQERFLFAFKREAERRKNAGLPRLQNKHVWEPAGATSGAFTQWADGSNGMVLDKCFLVSPVLRCNPHWLFDGSKTIDEGVGVDSNFDANAEPAGKPRTMRQVKIKGLAKLGDDGYYEEVEEEGWVDSYSPDPDAYGLRVKGDSMHPAIRNGSVVVVEPNGRLVPAEYVAIALTDGRKMVKELVFERIDEIVVESVNGNKRQTIDRRDIEQIHPVTAVVSPSKWRPA
jgi:hypothetical protein